MKANYHTHTYRCHHATGTEREYIENAIADGMQILGFSDHTPYFFDGDFYSHFRMRPNELEGYVDTLTKLKKEYEKDIEIHIGLECEYYPRYFEKLCEFLKDYPIEYLVQGQHFTHNETDGVYSGRITEDVNILKDYCNQTIEGMETGKFLYLAHPDLINFVGDVNIYKEEMGKLLLAAKRLDMPVEFNFLGLQEGRQYPNEILWEEVGKVGNKVIFGCDAHKAENTNRPDTYQIAMEHYVKKYGLNRIETVKLHM